MTQGRCALKSGHRMSEDCGATLGQTLPVTRTASGAVGDAVSLRAGPRGERTLRDRQTGIAPNCRAGGIVTLAITIRELDPDEWEVFRDMRLAALAAAPGVYGSRHEAMAARTELVWRNNVRGEHNQSFGLFDGPRLIGITSVFRWDEDSDGKTAILASSYILPAYRGRSLSRLLYDARFDWLRRHQGFTRVVVGHRLSNEASRRANQHYGFREFRRVPHLWNDGVTEDEVFYEMYL